MNTNLEDYDGIVDRIAEDFATPDVTGVYQIVEKRHDRRRHIQQGTAVFALLLVVAGAALWFNQPQTSEVATEPPTVEEARVNTTTTTEEIAVANPPNELRDLLVSTRSWTPIARDGIPETGSYAEYITFENSQTGYTVFLESCTIVPPYTIDWELDGFTITGKDLQVELATRGCDEPGQEGIALTPVQTGERVTVTPNDDGTYDLTGTDWSLTITAAEAPTQQSTTEATTTTTTTEQIAVTNPPNELRDLFQDVQAWSPIERTGIPDTLHSGEVVYFETNESTQLLTFSSCISAFYEVDWTDTGVIITGTYNPGEITTDGCDDGQEGIALTPVQTGERVAITPNDDGTYELTGTDWSLTITAKAPTQPSSTEAANTTTTTIEETN